MSIFDVWFQSWTMTDLIVFGTAALAIVAGVALRTFLEEKGH